jgi:hypothetical protein
MPEPTEHDWRELYKIALLETDWSKMEDRIQPAERTMQERLHEFSLHHGGTPEDNQAIADAMNGLKILRVDLARWQGQKRTG